MIFSAVFVILPLLLIVVYAFMDDAGHFTLGNFAKFFAHPEAINTFVYSIGVAIITTVVCILLGYPAAYILTQTRMKYASTVVVLFILPMWVNILIRTLATVALFDFMNVSLGEGALIFGMVYNFLPFMIYPIYNTLQKLDKSYVEAAQDLGANPMQVFFKAVLPLSMPGIVSGILMVFMPTISTFAIAGLLAGLCGFLMTSRVTIGQPTAAESYEMDAITACVVGGVSMTGGVGKPWGVVIGCLLITVIANGLDIMGVSSHWQKIVKGVIIVVAVLIDVKGKTKKN